MVRRLAGRSSGSSRTHPGTVQNLGPRGGARSVALLLELDPLEVLLVLELLLDVLISLEELVVFVVSDLQLFGHDSLLLLPGGVHLVLLLLDQLGFGSNDFLVSSLHVLLVLVFLQFLAPYLYFMGFRVPVGK